MVSEFFIFLRWPLDLTNYEWTKSHKNYGKKKSEGADSDDSLNEDIRRAKPRLDKGCPDAIMKEVGERKLLNCLLHEGPYNVQDCSTKANLSMIGMPLEESEVDGSGSDRELQVNRLGGIWVVKDVHGMELWVLRLGAIQRCPIVEANQAPRENVKLNENKSNPTLVEV